MSINNINSVLQRKLSPGLAYSKLIEKSTCKVTSLGEGDTFHSIDKIKEFSLKYQHQTKAVADRLVKNSLKETVNSFYKFCYDHFQYKADGLEQNIKSPACAWHSRKDGMDCKSFSVLASTLCSNAGLKHYIRKIKQPFFHPGEFTHVYVIIPINQNTGSTQNGYYVIDGTTHDNLEAVFTTKHDTYMDTMPHFGLNAPRPTKRVHPVGSRAAQAAINSCGRLKPGYTWNKGGRSITQHIGLKGGIGLNGADITRPMKAFCNLMSILRNAGVPDSITSEILKRLKQFTSQGIDPVVAISKEGIIIEGEFFRFQQPNKPAVVFPPIMVEFDTTQPGLGNPEGDGGTQGEDGTFDKVIDTAIGEINNEADGWLQNIFSKIVGFFNCIGSSATPKTAEDWAKKKVTPWFINRLYNLRSVGQKGTDAQFSNAVTTLMKELATIKAHQLFHKKESQSKCGKDANQAMADFAQRLIELMASTMGQLSANYNISSSNVNFTASQVTHLSFANNWKGKTTTATHTQYNLSLKPGGSSGFPDIVGQVPGYKPGTGSGSTGGGTTTTPGGSTGSGTTTTIKPSGSLVTVGQQPATQAAGMNWLLVFLLAGGFVYGLNHFKNQPNKK